MYDHISLPEVAAAQSKTHYQLIPKFQMCAKQTKRLQNEMTLKRMVTVKDRSLTYQNELLNGGPMTRAFLNSPNK